METKIKDIQALIEALENLNPEQNKDKIQSLREKYSLQSIVGLASA